MPSKNHIHKSPPENSAPLRIQVELFGLPRVITGQACITMGAGTLRDIIVEMTASYPGLIGPVVDPDSGWINSAYMFSVDGIFTQDPERQIHSGDSLLLMTRIAGGQ